MSAEIKVVSMATPPVVIKVGGKCYSLVQEAVVGKPDTELTDVSDTFLTCAACAAAGDVPNTCPTGLEATYKINITTPLVSGCTPSTYAGDAWDGVVTGSSCAWSVDAGGVLSKQFPTTSTTHFYGCYPGIFASISLVASVHWRVRLVTGNCSGWWVKTDGATPVGTYLNIGLGSSESDIVNTWLTPTSLTVSEVA